MSTSAIEHQSHLPGPPAIAMGSPPGSSPDAPGKPDSNAVTHDPSSPSATSKPSQPSQTALVSSTQQPNVNPSAPKRKRATAEEKEKERIEKKQKQDDVAAEKAKIAAEKEAIKVSKAAEKAAEKAAKAIEKAEKEAARMAKANEKAKIDAEKEAKRRKKQEEELAAQAKKDKQKSLLASFLKKAPTEPSKTSDRPNTTTKNNATSDPSNQTVTESTKSAYDLSFKPFFVKSGVTMAPVQFEMDMETKEVKSGILDEYIRGDRGEFTIDRPFNAAKTFDLAFPQKRGIIPPSVKKIMETIHGDPYQNAFGLSNTRSESQTEKLLVNAQDQLEAVPMKYIRFYEDVRPAYFGTITTPMTYHKLRRLCRRPVGKMLPLAYDYDSEAEWVEDDGEDLDDAEEEEEDIEGEEEMDDFVDDSELIPAIIRPGFEADSLPVSTGLCFENSERLGPSAVMCKYRLEFLLDSPEPRSSIDPFSAEYWPTPQKKAAPIATASQGTITAMLPPGTSRDVAATPELKDGVPQNILEEFKRTLLSDECNEYSKATVIEMLAKKFSNCTKAQVKVTLDTIAHRVTPADAAKKSVKRWALLPGFNLK